LGQSMQPESANNPSLRLEAKRRFVGPHTTSDYFLRIRHSSTGRCQRLPVLFFAVNVTRKPGQGGSAEGGVRDLRAELLVAEAAHRAKLQGGVSSDSADAPEAAVTASKRALPIEPHADDDEDPEAKRRRILEETRDIDADDSEEEDGSSEDSDDDDDDDEAAELQRELDKIKRERAEKREKEVSDAVRTPAEVTETGV